MKAAILAAGLGERLAAGGVAVPKPLVTVAGEPLIARAIRAAAAAGAAAVACIVNDRQPAVAEYLRAHSWPVPLELLVRTTASSMESLFALAPLLTSDPFLLLTVDAVCAPGNLPRFLSRARRLPAAAGVLALTRFVDDEKPLWVQLAAGGRIAAFGEPGRPRLVTAGFYYFRPEIFSRMAAARAVGLGALRQFLSLLAASGLPLYGVPVARTMDIDRPQDLQRAEAWLAGLAHG